MNNAKTPISQIKNKNLIVFDGECVLCSRFFHFVVWADTKKRFQFVTAQSAFGEALYDHYDLKPDDYDTNLVLIEGRLYERFHAFVAAMKLLGWPYRALAIFELLPDRLLDWLYYKIARNRYSLFGKRDTCLIPSDEIKARFIND
jgi:predicted DCC family thiol-disulfide oxidoreductase YuxK